MGQQTLEKQIESPCGATGPVIQVKVIEDLVAVARWALKLVSGRGASITVALAQRQ